MLCLPCGCHKTRQKSLSDFLTSITAIILLWFLSCFSYPRIVATAPTKQQLNDVLWSEVAKWQEKSPVLKKILKWTKTYVYMKGHDKRWFAVAKTATKPENMQGFHEDNMLFIVDEASGVADTIIGNYIAKHIILPFVRYEFEHFPCKQFYVFPVKRNTLLKYLKRFSHHPHTPLLLLSNHLLIHCHRPLPFLLEF